MNQETKEKVKEIIRDLQLKEKTEDNPIAKGFNLAAELNNKLIENAIKRIELISN